MPRVTPQHWRTLKKVFELVGFREERRKGDHICMVKPGVARAVVIPKYDQVGRDIILANLRTAGLSRDEYVKILSRV